MKTGIRKRSLEEHQDSSSSASPFVQAQDLSKEVQWAHGSTSVTLALMKFTKNQLVPYAKLPPFVVPFAGELEEGGSLGGVNQEGVSGVGSDDLH